MYTMLSITSAKISQIQMIIMNSFIYYSCPKDAMHQYKQPIQKGANFHAT